MLISTLSEGTYQAFPFNGIGKDPHMSMHRVLRERNSNAYDEVIKRKQFMVPPIQIPSSCKIPRLSTPKLPSLRNTSSTNALPRIMSSPLMSTTTDNPQGDLIGSAFMDTQSLAKARPDTTISPNLVSMYRDHYEYDYSPTTSQSSPLPFRSELVRKYAIDLNMKTDLMSMKRSGTKRCNFPMCTNSARSRGYCYSHGGGRRCCMPSCTNGAVSRDLCKRHGGGRRCKINGCKSSAESGGLCYSHGGGRRCNLSWCNARAKRGGKCAAHLNQSDSEDNYGAHNKDVGREVFSSTGKGSDVAQTLVDLAGEQACNSDTQSMSEGVEVMANDRDAYALATLLN